MMEPTAAEEAFEAFDDEKATVVVAAAVVAVANTSVRQDRRDQPKIQFKINIYDREYEKPTLFNLKII
jgi:hypothetical protein